ncbi:hypothetical protein [Falsiphaeobacter marinintestinus]|uniref:hypothetical protein n=1 Tax=Falsiphaeobacter marinintestinus TaxID=1492905 RepID=UPI001646778E|nr:hypothetical protein [Phaeobacter marinintestinus]
MINIYAQSFMTATRTDCVRMRDARKPDAAKPKRRWLPEGHWWTQKTHCKSPGDL